MNKVYFIQCRHAVKVGTTRLPVQARIAALATGNPFPVRLLAVIPGGIDLERLIHRELAGAHLRGEWFSAHQGRRVLARYDVRPWLPFEVRFHARQKTRPVPRVGAPAWVNPSREPTGWMCLFYALARSENDAMAKALDLYQGLEHHPVTGGNFVELIEDREDSWHHFDREDIP